LEAHDAVRDTIRKWLRIEKEISGILDSISEACGICEFSDCNSCLVRLVGLKGCDAYVFPVIKYLRRAYKASGEVLEKLEQLRFKVAQTDRDTLAEYAADDFYDEKPDIRDY